MSACMSPLISSPSTADFSIFSCPDSIPSASTSHTGTPKSRKRSRGTQEIKVPQKRRKVIGRPKNAWTASRRRKLVRLYLMTNLEPDEIAKVLRTDSFKPCKRNVQDQIKSLLQDRPDKIRFKGHITKQRLRHLRECRNAQVSRCGTKSQYRNPTIWNERGDGGDILAPNVAEITSETVISTNRNFEHPLLGLDSRWNAPLVAVEGSVLEEPAAQQHKFKGASPINSTLLEDFGLALFPEDQVIESLGKITPPPTTAASDGLTLNFPLPPLSPTGPSFQSSITISTSQSGKLHEPTDTLTSVASRSTAIEASNPLPFEQTSFESDSDSLVVPTDPSVGMISNTDNQPHTKLGTPRPTTLTAAILRKRLSHTTDKYSHSTLEDIVSLMEHSTISTSSSSTAPSRWSRWSKTAPSTYLPVVEEHVAFPLNVDHPVVLPGAFPEHCWEHIINNRLRRCNKGQKYRQVKICGHIGRRPRQFTSDHSPQYKAYVGPGGEKVDIFSNSALHVAAALATPPRLLISLVRSDISIHTLNTAGQTFLHLIRPDCDNFYVEEEYGLEFGICVLLRELKDRGFNFLQQDHNGRASLHWLTRPEISRSALLRISKAICELHIPLPPSRDNLGCIVADQMILWGVFDPYGQPNSKKYSFSRDTQLAEDGYIHNYETNCLIQTVDDLERYAYHTDLLKTIKESRKNPHFEDTRGRNGLHCLAEVSFDLHLSEGHSSPIQPPQEKSSHATMLEQNLEYLLDAGVNPNSHDMEGMTPFMAFVIHMRPCEDDNSTMRPLQLLLDFGADINRRNRQGLASLHLAIKLGRRAATKFLLKVGANVHARIDNGLGILALGHKSTKEAKHDESLYAQIMLCVSLAVSSGAVSTPTILKEWGMKDLVEFPLDERRI